VSVKIAVYCDMTPHSSVSGWLTERRHIPEDGNV